MKLHIVLAFKSGLPLEDPLVTESEKEARKSFKAYCEDLGLDEFDPHDGESDIWWWFVEI